MLNWDDVSEHFARQVRRELLATGARPVTLAMRVTRAGRVDRACLVKRSGIPLVDRAAIEAAHRLRLRPAMLDGEPRSTTIQATFRIR